MEARLRNLTYSAPILLEMTIEEEGLPRDTTRQHIGDLPVMVKSELCQLSNRSKEQLIESGEDPNDPGGYFIINGAERVIVGLEDLSPNKILVDSEKVSGATTYKSRVYSSVVGYRSKLELTLKQDGAINVKVPSCPVDLPFVIVMRALGVKSDKDIADAVSPKAEIQDLLEVSFDKASEAPTEKDSLVYIGNRVAHGMLEEFRVKRAQSMLDWGLLPHLGKTEDRRFDKAMFMGEAVCKLLELRLGWIERRRQGPLRQQGNQVRWPDARRPVQDGLQEPRQGHEVPAREDRPEARRERGRGGHPDRDHHRQAQQRNRDRELGDEARWG